jgi:hypothetical protein
VPVLLRVYERSEYATCEGTEYVRVGGLSERGWKVRTDERYDGKDTVSTTLTELKTTYLDISIQSLKFHEIDTSTTVRIEYIYSSALRRPRVD